MTLARSFNILEETMSEDTYARIMSLSDCWNDLCFAPQCFFPRREISSDPCVKWTDISHAWSYDIDIIPSSPNIGDSSDMMCKLSLIYVQGHTHCWENRPIESLHIYLRKNPPDRCFFTWSCVSKQHSFVPPWSSFITITFLLCIPDIMFESWKRSRALE